MISLNIKYETPVKNDICVVLCFFSPMGFKKPIQNIQYNIKLLKTANIPHVVIELLYPNQNQNIKNSIVVRSNTVLFSKENLWNIAERFVPEKYTKLLFLDSDILFDKPNWLDLTSNLLEYNDIVQPMEYACKDVTFDAISIGNIDLPLDDKKICKAPVTKAIKNKEKIILGIHQPGFGIAMNRTFFKRINGFFEYGITGSSDVMFWLSIIDFNTKEAKDLLEKIPESKKRYESYRVNMQQHIDINRIDYVPDCIGLHLYHGNEDNRFYQTRNKYVPESIDFYYNEYGVLEIQTKDNTDLKQYWIDRKEDE